MSTKMFTIVLLIVLASSVAYAFPTLSVEPGSHNLADPGICAGNANVVLHVGLRAGSTEGCILQMITLDGSGTGDQQNDIQRISIVRDNDEDGVWDPSEVEIGYRAGGYPVGNTATIPISPPYTIPANIKYEFMIVYQLALATDIGDTFAVTIPVGGIVATGAASGQPANVAGLPAAGNQKVVNGKLIPNVPDGNQPPNNPVGYPNVNNYCGPVAAVNISEYWDTVMADARAANVNAGQGTQGAAAYIGYWMDTNDNWTAVIPSTPMGCPYRANGTTFASANGTYVADLMPGAVQFARWDAANNFGCNTPALPGNPAKSGHSWTVRTDHNMTPGMNPLQAWNDMASEIHGNAPQGRPSRPLMITFSYWNPAGGWKGTDGVTYYTWGAVQGGSADPNEQWNHPDNPDEEYGGIPYGAATVGHCVTSVGYRVNYDPDNFGAGKNGPLPQTDWIICHDNWAGTACDMAIPWRTLNQPLNWCAWVASTYVDLAAPQVGTLAVAAGPWDPVKPWVWPGGQTVMAQLRFTAAGVEGSMINALALVAGGTGNNRADIGSIALIQDVNSNGIYDSLDTLIFSSPGGYGLGNTVTIRLPDNTFVIPSGATCDMLVVYTMAAVAVNYGATYNFQITGITAVGAVTFLPISPPGLPYNSPTATLVMGPIIADVPDGNQPPQDPLGTGNVTNYCAPMSAVNITQYWERNLPGVNAGLGTQGAAGYIGYWMDTNNNGCPFRANGRLAGYLRAKGTYVRDLSPGVVSYVRWDNANTYGCTPPPNLPNGKQGFSIKSATMDNMQNNAGVGWQQMQVEINSGNPLMVTFCYWNPTGGWVGPEGITYYTWGALQNPQPEYWNHPSNPDGAYGGTPHGSQTIGHCVTVIGYFTNYDPDGAGPTNPLPQTDWVVVRDNWANTAKDMAIPWRTMNQPMNWSAWVANTLVGLTPLPQGTLAVGIGFNTPGNHNWVPGGGWNVMQQLRLTTGPNEAVYLEAMDLQAAGSGNDATDISQIYMYDDSDNDGRIDGGDQLIMWTKAGQPYSGDNGTAKLLNTGILVKVPASTTKNVIVLYSMKNTAPVGNTFSFSAKAVYGSGEFSLLPAQATGLAIGSATKTVSQIGVQPPGHDLGWAKQQPDGTFTSLTIDEYEKRVTTEGGSLQSSIYIQEEDRSCGIQCYFGGPAPTIEKGTKVLCVEGYIGTLNGERVITQPVLWLSTEPPESVPPLGLNNRAVGGGDWFYDNPTTGKGQKGVLGGVGLNNIGLLVQTCGRVTYVDPTTFTLDDGSGVNLKCVAAGFTVNPTWEYVAITGVSSTEMPGSQLLPVLRLRTLDDVVPLIPPPP